MDRSQSVWTPARGGAPAAADGWRSITGKENPELLLPTELFKNLVELTLVAESPELRSHFREKFRIRAIALGLDDDFFQVLEGFTKEYATESTRIRQLSKKDAKEGAAAQSASALARCALVARALADARKHYGEAFEGSSTKPSRSIRTSRPHDRDGCLPWKEVAHETRPHHRHRPLGASRRALADGHLTGGVDCRESRKARCRPSDCHV